MHGVLEYLCCFLHSPSVEYVGERFLFLSDSFAAWLCYFVEWVSVNIGQCPKPGCDIEGRY